MSRAVSGVFGTSIATPSSYSSAKSNDVSDDDSSFGDAFDRAQSKASGNSDQSSTAGVSESKSAAPKAAKPASGRKTAGKKSATETDGDQSKVATDATDPTAKEVEPDPGQGDAEGGTDEQGEGTDRQQKKIASATDAVPTDMPSAIVQLQGGTMPNSLPVDRSSLKDGSSATKAEKPVPPAKARVAAADGSTTKNPISKPDATDPAGAEASEPTGEEDAASSEASTRASKTRLAIQPKNSGGSQESSGSSDLNGAIAQQASLAPASSQPDNPANPSQIPLVGPAVPAVRTGHKGADDLVSQSLPLQAASTPTSGAAPASEASDADDAQSSPETQFVDANHPRIVSGITGRMLPSGGSMQIRLDPPELGAIQVRVEMHNGVMTASFETSNDQASRLLSHSLGDLRSALETQGVSVQKLQVSQQPRQQPSSGDSPKDGSHTPQDTAGQQEQQRKEMVRRMWQKLMGGQDPVDLVA